MTSNGLAIYLDPSADCISHLVFRPPSGLHGNSSLTAIPVALPSAVSQQDSQSSAAQLQSSDSLEAEVAELAGASIEDSFEMNNVESSQQMTPRGGIDIEDNSSHRHLSSEWENAATEGEF